MDESATGSANLWSEPAARDHRCAIGCRLTTAIDLRPDPLDFERQLADANAVVRRERALEHEPRIYAKGANLRKERTNSPRGALTGPALSRRFVHAPTTERR